MEPLGLSVSIVGLAGLFNNAVECFEYVVLSRNFGKAFQTNLLKLDNARLRLSRWGQSLGMSCDLESLKSLDKALLPVGDVHRAGEKLGQILELFSDAERVLNKFTNHGGPHDSRSLVFGVNTTTETVGLSLQEKMRGVAQKRQNKTGIGRRAKWAIYEEKHFRRLVEDITDLVNDVVDLFPASQSHLQARFPKESMEKSAKKSSGILQDTNTERDSLVEHTASKVIASRRKSIPAIVFSEHNSGFQIGFNMRSVSNFSCIGS